MARPGYWFAVNLRPETTTDAFLRSARPWGWLAAPENTTRATRAFATDVTRRRKTVIADNGNFARIGEINARFEVEGRALRAELDRLEDRLGERTAVRDDLPAALRRRYDALAATAAAAALDASPEAGALLAAQRDMPASLRVGAEDLRAAVLLSLNVEPHLIDWPRRRWRAFNRRVALQATHLLAENPAVTSSYYPVASALDWASALDAGREFAAAGLRRAAMGFGAFMADDHGTDFVRIGRRTVRFTSRLPQRYVRTAVVARGFFDGYREVAGAPPDAFHFLGLGTPIMVAVVAVAADGVPLVTFDAMSPIKDAVTGTLYAARPTYLKLRARVIGGRIAAGTRRPWSCPCPFCRDFARRHPPDLAAARAWGATHPDPPRAADLRPGGALFDALLLLGEPSGGPLRREVTAARVGHNHWVLNQICADLRRHAGADRLREGVSATVDAYGRATTPYFAKAVRFGFELAAG
jgi:hypothetical protein